MRTGSAEETCIITSRSDTIGVIYLDSQQTALDLSSGNRELLQTLALEASTILENARLLEEERVKQRMEEGTHHRARDSDQPASAATAVQWLVSVRARVFHHMKSAGTASMCGNFAGCLVAGSYRRFGQRGQFRVCWQRCCKAASDRIECAAGHRADDEPHQPVSE